MNWKKIAEMREGINWGLVASVALHLAFFAAFFLELPDLPKAEKEETVNVQLVPPPEEKKPEPPKPEEKKPEEQAKKEGPAPPPPPPPAEKKEEQAKKEPPPPPSIPALRRVFQFGEKDTGPEKADGGNSSQGEARPATSAPKPHAAPEPPAPPPPIGTAGTVKEPPANPVPQDVKVPEVETAGAALGKDGLAAQTANDAKTTFELAEPPKQTKPDSKEASVSAKPMEPGELTEAKTLFSRAVTDDPVAMTAMGNLPRSVRFDELCGSELQEQLRHASPAYDPVRMPAYRLQSGTVLQVNSGAFLDRLGWYDLSFRCEVDSDAMKVLSFAFKVRGPLPKSKWRSRGIFE
ncbi:DUF930 domain-containing protein [Rhizobium sp. BK251]|uniref:DUF930 domain-containing protein n=1 Tax=Rhizobium sp. BK251 TaxID=2512125 RepID=UPI001FDED94E|nr:DUF930 domain-containing protein [Rhizobium sp. BK251]